MKTLHTNWKKRATMQFPDEEIERAFMDQAYGFIQNKAGKLLSDPHRLGFEIVYKNDNSTRMVGIFAFRADDRLLYAPCFFINGEIKGTDLLYQHDRKLFVPLTERWVDYLLKTQNPNQGQGYKGDSKTLKRQADLYKLSVPPSGRGYSKFASANGLPSTDELWAEMLKSATLQPILQRFLVEDGGIPAVSMIGQAVEHSMKFARSLSDLDDQTYAPDQLVEQTKQAAEASRPVPTLRLYRGFSEHTKSAAAQAQLLKFGFSIEDDRKRDLNAIEVGDLQMEGVGCSGRYRLLLKDGQMKEGVVVVGSPCDHYSRGEGGEGLTIIWDDQTVTRCHGRAYGEQVEGELKDVENVTDTPKAGKTYICIDPSSDSHSRAIRVVGSRKREGIQLLKVDHPWSGESELVINPDLQGLHLDEGYVGAGCLWATCKTHKPDHCVGWEVVDGPEVGDDQSLETLLRKSGSVKGQLYHDELGWTLKVAGRVVGRELDDVETIVRLARDLSIPGDQAVGLMKLASDRPTRWNRTDPQSFWMDQEGLEKSGAMRVLEEPQFENEFDSDFGVEVDPGHMQALEIDTPSERIPAMRLRETQPDEGAPMQQLLNDSPEDLAQFAQMNQLPQLFEHGVVGSLVRSFDSASLVDRYIPDLEKALDALGRALFLIFWKPGEFDDAWGPEERQNQEDEMLSAFKSFGDLVLNLLNKSPTNRGTAVPGGSSRS